MKIKGAIFDMDGTLADSMVFWDELWGLIENAYCDGKAFRPKAEDEEKMRALGFDSVIFEGYIPEDK